MNDPVTVIKRSNIVAGICAIILGIVILVWPGASLATIALLLGIQLILWGGVAIVGSFMMSSGGSMAWGLIGGILSVVLGVAAFRNPGDTVAIIALMIGAAWFVSGIFEFFESFQGPGTSWGLMLYSILSIVAGLILMATPIESAGALAIASGIMLIAMGAAQIISANQTAEQIDEMMA